ncbi:unannotated protein [freshwater metagenome]|uniref:Unannotated protein n=1 Tax=freshwater metagenome TaxID=449393 RepID=A0A6J7IAB1_9ZZZZ|nr:nitroreductase family deazaflavin-dependent oxidoreductase [Actinomycetota bacterium]
MAETQAEIDRRTIEEFRANGGVISAFPDQPFLVLTTTGARSGVRRTTPLVCLPDDEGTLHIFASKAGADTHPAWLHNLRANPQATVEFGTETFEATAEEVEGPLRDELYARQVEAMPVFAGYQAGTDRRIPVVALRRS